MLYKALPVKHSLLKLKESSVAGSYSKLPIDIVVKRVSNAHVSINSQIITGANVPQTTKKAPIGVSTNFTRNMFLPKSTVLQTYGHVLSSGSISDRSLSSDKNSSKVLPLSKRPSYVNNNKTLIDNTKNNNSCDASNGNALNSGGSQLFNASIF